jgi:hypothetical protein
MPSFFMSLLDSELAKEKSAFGFKSLRKVKSIADHQTGKTNIKRDKARKAMPPGKRRSASGKIYWEYRKSRSDLPGEDI